MRRVFAAAALFAALAAVAGCSGGSSWFGSRTPEAPAQPNIFPSAFKAQILATVPKVVDDPSGIVNAFYSEPAINTDTGVTVYSSCVRFNPRGPNKQYLGDREYVAYYYGGRLDQFFRTTDDRCAKAAYKPFPELQHLCAPNVKNQKICP